MEGMNLLVTQTAIPLNPDLVSHFMDLFIRPHLIPVAFLKQITHCIDLQDLAIDIQHSSYSPSIPQKLTNTNK